MFDFTTVDRCRLSKSYNGSGTESILTHKKPTDFPLLLDTKGPEIRTGKTAEDAVIVHNGEQFRLVRSNKNGPSIFIPFDYSCLHQQ